MFDCSLIWVGLLGVFCAEGNVWISTSKSKRFCCDKIKKRMGVVGRKKVATATVTHGKVRKRRGGLLHENCAKLWCF